MEPATRTKDEIWTTSPHTTATTTAKTFAMATPPPKTRATAHKSGHTVHGTRQGGIEPTPGRKGEHPARALLPGWQRGGFNTVASAWAPLPPSPSPLGPANGGWPEGCVPRCPCLLRLALRAPPAPPRPVRPMGGGPKGASLGALVSCGLRSGPPTLGAPPYGAESPQRICYACAAPPTTQHRHHKHIITTPPPQPRRDQSRHESNSVITAHSSTRNPPPDNDGNNQDQLRLAQE